MVSQGDYDTDENGSIENNRSTAIDIENTHEHGHVNKNYDFSVDSGISNSDANSSGGRSSSNCNNDLYDRSSPAVLEVTVLGDKGPEVIIDNQLRHGVTAKPASDDVDEQTVLRNALNRSQDPIVRERPIEHSSVVVEPIIPERTKGVAVDSRTSAAELDAHDDGTPIATSSSSNKLVLTMSFGVLVIAAAALVWYYMGWATAVLVGGVAAVAYLVASFSGERNAGILRWLYVALKTSPRDIKAVLRYIKILWMIRNYQKENLTIVDIFRQNVAKHPQKACFLFDGREWTFADIEEYSNRVANVLKTHGYRKGDRIALLMENRPEFVATWLGLSKLGVIVPLINTNLRQNSLLHSFTIADCQAIIFGAELIEAMKEISESLDSKIALYRQGSDTDGVGELKEHNMNALLRDAPSAAPEPSEKPGYHDALIYIYTSGTTGLPKAAVINHSRFIFIAGGMHHAAGFRVDDRYYTPLPLYHTAGGCMTVGQALLFGSTVVLRKKFSASAYFADCRKYNCTVAQYIGEMCRYILAVPPKADDKNHNVRLIFGNGLRPQIWTEFIERFNIANVAEFYGATEGNANIVNMDNTVGAIGFVSRILPSVYPISIIRVDESGEPLRTSKGLCIVCKPGEPGVFIGKIIQNNPGRAFLGYVDKKASEKKIVRDVFKKGDSAFISGDILVSDEYGNLFFKDRTGDTFRWKGENVSTSEVEAVISNIISYKDAVVYGVEISGQEGRAGMAAILDLDDTLDLNVLADGVRKQLPVYARPLFVRILRKLDMTGTYKLKKNDLQKEGFDPSKISDRVYYLNPDGKYVSLTDESYEQINAGKIRL